MQKKKTPRSNMRSNNFFRSNVVPLNNNNRKKHTIVIFEVKIFIVQSIEIITFKKQGSLKMTN